MTVDDTQTLDGNKAAAWRFIEAMVTGDHAGLTAVTAPDFRMWAGGDLAPSGWADRESFLARMARVGGGRSSLFTGPVRFDIGHVTAEGDRVSMEAEIHAPLPDGGEYNNQFHFLFLVRDGLVVEAKEYMDTLHVTQRLPIAPSDRERPSNLTVISGSIAT